MHSPAQPESRFQPRFPLLAAGGVFLLAALSLMWPMLQGKFLAGSDQIHAGYAFRALATQGMQRAGHIPQWNPFIFGGMPLWAVPGHFDVFYPTAWLRFFLRADTVLTLSFFIHFVVAGLAMYALLRTLRASWTAAVVAGLAYELSGMVASQVSPGHDGKMFAAALAPFAFVALIRAIRHGRTASFGWFALVIGLVLLTPHYLAAYYLLIASALFTLWLVFLDPERVRGRSPVVPLVMAAAAVVLGFGLAMVELLPVQHMVEYTARGTGGASLGYTYASSWGMAPVELMTVILPQFNGVLDHYWGPNFFKDHTEYLGALVLMLMVFGIPAARKRGLLLPLSTIAVLFLLVAWGGYTSFYRLWYLLPRMGQFRAPGLAFYLVALAACVFAGLGVDQLLEGLVKRGTLLVAAGVLGVIALLAASGGLQSITESLTSDPRLAQRAIDNASDLQRGGIRLLLIVLVGGGAFWLLQARKLSGWAAALVLCVVVGADNWSILREFPRWLPPASVTFADDPLTIEMKKTPLPFRAYSPEAPDAQDAQVNALTVYPASSLMARGVPSLLGYHGMESKFFDNLLGGKNLWRYQYTPNIWNLYAVKYVVLTQEPPTLPGYHKIRGPLELDELPFLAAPQGVLFERDSAPQWVRVVPAAVKVAEDDIAPTVINDNFPINSYVLYSDTTSIQAIPAAKATTMPEPTAVKASLTAWSPGSMTVKLDGTDTRTTYLVVAENWYPDWHATIDGKSAPAYRGNGAMLTVALPPSAKEVTLKFDIATYHTGKIVSLLALVLVAGLLFADRRPRAVHA